MNTPNNPADVNTAQAAHTPTPWKVLKGTNAGQAEFGASHTGDYIAVFGSNDEPICSSGDKCYWPHPISEANAEFIVRAVNSHTDLVQNLARLVERVQKVNAALRSKGETEFVGAWFGDGILTEVQSALQKAEVQS